MQTRYGLACEGLSDKGEKPSVEEWHQSIKGSSLDPRIPSLVHPYNG